MWVTVRILWVGIYLITNTVLYLECIFRVFGDSCILFIHCSYRLLQVNIGSVVFPSYPILISRPLFESSEHYDRYGLSFLLFFLMFVVCLGTI